MGTVISCIVLGGFLFGGFAPETFMRFYCWCKRVATHLASL